MDVLLVLMLVGLTGLSLRYIRAVRRLKKAEMQLEQVFQEQFPDEQVRLGGLARYRQYNNLLNTDESRALLNEAEKWIRRSQLKFSLALTVALLWIICYVWTYGIAG